MSILLGKVLVTGAVEVKTGLRVGGTSGGLKIGGVDLPVITDPWGRPYLPGSSLKGKMRSLVEKKEGVPVEKGQHRCRNEADYRRCPVCPVWGTLPDKDFTGLSLTRLLVRDTFLDETSITGEMGKNLDLKWTEVKVETAIDRSKGSALNKSLRQIERVPAGGRFSPCEIIFNIFEEGDKDLFKKIFEALLLVEDDYLGGMGSRGYGKVAFTQMKIFWNRRGDYETGSVNQKQLNGTADTPALILKDFENIKKQLT
ncbi:MAG: RAMP superfamily protein [candidate division TA06 bacterium ADurb.Bin417]|uniref:CRISPR system Cms endoribonuclease Csm3 n=1 Tax=candidate division TA06 bacterium ADurb.Bin417 TaxID=1852828 RepID=A0A1V5MKN9_UNCT6|nr:MAG: RAMP superfamily protein [candidate division TA06 bacterium ADurb.Bin417]